MNRIQQMMCALSLQNLRFQRALKSVRKPYMRNPPVWLDERGKETVRFYTAPSSFPRLNLNGGCRDVHSTEKEQVSILGQGPDLVVDQPFQFID